MAYDMFVCWLEANENLVLRRRFIDFQDVYGDEFKVRQRNLFKYFTKSFGCRLADAGVTVPWDMVALLGQDSFITKLQLSFTVNEDALLLPLEDRQGFIGKGALLSCGQDERPDSLGFMWQEHISWLHINHWYNLYPDGRLGAPWIANSQFLYLGACTPLTPQQRAELELNVAQRE